MKRQATLRSSSSGREAAASAADHQSTTVQHAANSVGCMAGVFQLISSKYRTRRKFLTFGRKQQVKQTASVTSSPQQLKPKSPARKSRGDTCDRFQGSREIRRLSCEVPRSPTIPPEIRRSNSLNSPESFRSPVSSIVARLMGLEEPPAPEVAVMPSPIESASEKRRKLLGALEKCDEDLQSLKKIIESVRSVDRSKMPPLVSVGKCGEMVEIKKCTDSVNGTIEQEQPSPVSVLDDFCESPPPLSTGDLHYSKRVNYDMCRLGRVVTAHQHQKKRPGEDNVEIASFCFHNTNNRIQVSSSLFEPKSWTTTVSPPQSSGASMAEAVNEVCKDIEMGQKREKERLGVVVEDFIYRDLMDEITKDLMGRCHVESCLPFDKCKRKLCF